jgi:predicted ATPase
MLLIRNGQRGAALAQYERCRHALAEELGVEPSAALIALYEQIRNEQPQAEPGVIQAGRPETVTLPEAERRQTAHNLPAPVKSFFGRQVELARLKTYLQAPETRLVTLVGLGGMGKTELALWAARALLPDFVDGIWFVPLASVEVPADVQVIWLERLRQAIATAIAAALELGLSGGQLPEAQVKAYLRPKKLLLVIDNFEHLIEGAAFLQELLQAAPGLKLLVTSRERLGLPAEWALEVEGLSYPPVPAAEPDWGQADIIDPYRHWETAAGLAELSGFTSVSLLVERARQVDGAFTLSAKNSVAVVKLCQLVEGMPLGLELAAGQVRGFSLEQIVTAVEAQIDLFQTTLRHNSARHRSLRAVFEWSWSLLAPDQQRLFAQLSVFHGGFDAAGAKAIAQATGPDLLVLLDKSFLRLNAAQRYELHELLRQFGLEKLQMMAAASPAEGGLEAESRNRHAGYYARLLAQHQDRLYPNPDPASRQLIEQELDNIRAMWSWATNPNHPPLPEILAQAQTVLFHYYYMHGFFQEGLTVFGQAVERLREWVDNAQEHSVPSDFTQPPAWLMARLLVYRSRMAGQRGQYPLALAAGQQALALAQDSRASQIQVEAHLALADILMKQGQYLAARDTLQQALPLAQTLAQPFPAIRTCDLLAWTYWYQADLNQARSYADLALAGYRTLNHLPRVAGVLNLLGKILYCKGEYLESRKALEEALAIYRQLNHRGGQIPILGNLGKMYRHMGAYEIARRYQEQVVALSREDGQQELHMYALEELGRLYQALGDSQTAYQYAQRTRALASSLGSPLGEWGGETCLGNALIGLGDLAGAEEAHQAAWHKQQRLGQTSAGLENLAELAHIALLRGQAKVALTWVEKILGWFIEHDPASVSQLLSIYWICYQVLQANQDIRAVELLGTAYLELQRRADALTETTLRHSFLEESVPHREITRAWLEIEFSKS